MPLVWQPEHASAELQARKHRAAADDELCLLAEQRGGCSDVTERRAAGFGVGDGSTCGTIIARIRAEPQRDTSSLLIQQPLVVSVVCRHGAAEARRVKVCAERLQLGAVVVVGRVQLERSR